MIRSILKSQFLRPRKIFSDASDYIEKSVEYSNFSIKQGYDNFKLKMLAKDMLAKTCDELLTQNKKAKDDNGYNLASITEIFIQNTLRKISSTYWKGHHLKKVFPEKPIIAFHKMKSIRNYIVRTDIKEADDQKEPKITRRCYLCRKTCHLISRDETVKNIHNG